MPSCSLCHKKVQLDDGTLFNVPKDANKRRKWSEICSKTFGVNARICQDHFSPADVVQKANKTLLTRNAVPIVPAVNCGKNVKPLSENLENKNLKDFLLDTSIEYVAIQENIGISKHECRCCKTPSTSIIKLDVLINTGNGTQKTYKDLFYEITKLSISKYEDNLMPQQICHKCVEQLKSSYKFMQQACKVSQEYLEIINQKKSLQDFKNIELLQETLIEISEASTAEGLHEQLKVEPLNIKSNIDIKEEKLESDKEVEDDESHEERDFLQNSKSEEPTTEDDEDSDDPESLKDNEAKLNDKTLARSCDVCHKVYRNEKFLNIHKRYTHMPEEEKLPCPLCTYKCSRLSAIKSHMGLIHGQDKVAEYFKPSVDQTRIYSCNLCHRSYKTTEGRRKHIRRKHLNKTPKEESTKELKPPKPKYEKKFLCTYCGQSYGSNCALASHVLIHTGERPFSCDICSKTFRRVKDLQLHTVIHKDEKPHQCSECGKGFKRVDKLKVHMRVHSELRPYKCSECEKTFKYPNVLKTHMHIHTGLTPYACKTCGEAFSLRTSLNNHCLKNGHVK